MRKLGSILLSLSIVASNCTKNKQLNLWMAILLDQVKEMNWHLPIGDRSSIKHGEADSFTIDRK